MSYSALNFPNHQYVNEVNRWIPRDEHSGIYACMQQFLYQRKQFELLIIKEENNLSCKLDLVKYFTRRSRHEDTDISSRSTSSSKEGRSFGFGCQQLRINWYLQIRVIRHFRITFGLLLKASPGAHPFLWKYVFIHMQFKIIVTWKDGRQDSLLRRGQR